LFGGRAQPFGLSAHTSIPRWGVVIVAEEMKETVRQELRQLGDDTAATLFRLPPSRRNADDDVSKKPACAIADRPLSLRERENIRRTIVPPVPVIEPSDPVVPRKKYRKLGA
jgi:hypothetical protein